MVEKILPLSRRTQREPFVLPVLSRRGLTVEEPCARSLLHHPDVKRDSVADQAIAGADIVQWPPHGEPMLAFGVGQAILETRTAKAGRGKGARAKAADPCSGLGELVETLTRAENGCSVLRLMTPLRPGAGRMRSFTIEVEVASRDSARTESAGRDSNDMWRRAVGFAAIL